MKIHSSNPVADSCRATADSGINVAIRGCGVDRGKSASTAMCSEGIGTDTNQDNARTASVSMDTIMPVIKEQLALGQSVKFSPRGISMLPMLRQETDSIELSPLTEPIKKYDIPLYQRDNGHYVLHRVVAVGESLTCIGDNQYTCERGIRTDQLIGVVTAFYRGSKRHTTDEIGYRTYCVLWHKSRKIRHFALRGARWIRRHLRWTKG